MVVDRKTMPVPGTIPEIKLKDPENYKLSNGLDFYLISGGQEKVTRLDIVFEAGSAFQNKKLTAASVSSLLKEGTKTKTSSEIVEILDYYGAHLNTGNNKDTATLTLFSLTKHLDKLVPLISEMLTEPTFPQRELEIFMNRKKQRYYVDIQKVKYRAALEFNKTIFGKNTAYGQVLSETDFDLITRDDIVEFYDNYYCPANAYAVISGNIDSKTEQLVDKYLGNINCSGKMPDSASLKFFSAPETKEKYVEKEDALQSAIRVGNQTVNRTHPDYAYVSLLNTILGGYFGSRLMSNLREEKGFTYGIYSFVQTYQKAAYFAVATEVKADATGEALKEITGEIDRLKSEPVSEDELKLVKNYISGNILRGFDGSMVMADRFLLVKDFGLTFQHYRDVLKKMTDSTPQQLLEAAGKYFNSDDMVQLVVGKMR